MAFLKDSRCKCGGKYLITCFEEADEYYVDSGICQTCFKEIILPQEKYIPFVKEHGEGKLMTMPWDV